jgi:hypothetical protein
MATPERRTVPGSPAVPVAAQAAAGPVPVMGPLGWLLIVGAGVGLILATWTLYGTGATGMWAGYRDGVTATVVVIAAMALNTTLPRQPILGVLGLCGILLILFAVFIDDGTVVFISEIVAGVVLLAGVALYSSGRRS